MPWEHSERLQCWLADVPTHSSDLAEKWVDPGPDSSSDARPWTDSSSRKYILYRVRTQERGKKNIRPPVAVHKVREERSLEI